MKNLTNGFGKINERTIEMSFKLDDYARGLYGEKEYTIREGILSGKGRIVVKNDYTNSFKNAYYYKEGIFIIQINGTQAKAFAKKNNIEISRI